MNIEQRLIKILPQVEKPARYIGGEWNEIKKDFDSARVKFALAFPDAYEIGMSHTGLRILYDLLNKNPDVVAERVFAPWRDMEEKLREENIPLYSLESKKSLRDFDIIGFSLMYELCYTNMLAMMNLAGIPLRTADRDLDEPLIIAGGTCTVNPEPITDFVDAFVVGDGEEIVFEIVEKYMSLKGGGLGKREILWEIAQIPGVYVPCLYETSIDPASGMLLPRKTAGVPFPVRRRILMDLNRYPFPTKTLVPYTEIVFDRVSLELFRGCERGCRFCQAGVIYRPTRERNPVQVFQAAVEQVKNSGYEEISLNSLSTGDYSRLPQLLTWLNQQFQTDRVALSLSSLFASSITKDIIRQIKQVRKTGFTIAPEGGTDRMRKVINKFMSESEILHAAELAYKEGWEHIKLYFMIGQPTETIEDVEGIVYLARKISELGKRQHHRSGKVHLGVSSFVPKPQTPFQWIAMDSRESLLEKQALIRRMIRGSKIEMSWHHINISMLDGVFSRGDRRLNKTVELAYQKGCRFDGWSDCTHYGSWEEAFVESGVNPEQYRAEFDMNWTLPWDHISSKVAKKFLKKEWEKAVNEEVTPLTGFDNCVFCGACKASDLVQLKGLSETAKQSQPDEIQPVIEFADRERNFRFRSSFRKSGVLRFISHLDLTKTLKLAFKRAEIPLSYSRGFHPQPQISFGPALPMNVESREELLDFYTYEFLDPVEFVKRINAHIPAELCFLDAVQVPKNAPSLSVLVSGADYRVDFSHPASQQVMAEVGARMGVPQESALEWVVEHFHERSEVPFEKRKSGKVVNAKDFVRSIEIQDQGKSLFVEMKITEGSTIGIHQLMKLLLDVPVELPVTRERLYIWDDSIKQSPLSVDSDSRQTQRHLLELMS